MINNEGKVESVEEIGKKKNTLPIIIFCILLFTLIHVSNKPLLVVIFEKCSIIFKHGGHPP